jgi:hypothetical protein
VLKPGEPAPPPKPPTPKAKADAAVEPATAPPKPKPAEPKPAAAPPPKPPTTTAPKPKTATAPPPRPPTTATPKAAATEIDAMITELESVDPPEGYQRELLIVYNELFTVAEHKIAVFGKEKIERKFEKVKDPPEGTFMAEGFIPRVIVKNGRVLGIELLKGTPDAILSPIKAEMKERLGDLISFFRSELEDESAPDKKKKGKPKGKKLVAK